MKKVYSCIYSTIRESLVLEKCNWCGSQHSERFFKKFLGPLVPPFWISGDVFSGFKNCNIHCLFLNNCNCNTIRRSQIWQFSPCRTMSNAARNIQTGYF